MKLKDITEWPERWSIPSGKATQMHRSQTLCVTRHSTFSCERVVSGWQALRFRTNDEYWTTSNR